MLQKTKKHRNSRWCKGGIRVSAARTVEVQYFERDRKGKWRLQEDQFNEIDFCQRFAQELIGFRKGARIYSKYVMSKVPKRARAA